MITAETQVSKIRSSGYSLHITIPIAIVREYDLNNRDEIYWIPEPGGFKLKFLKRTAVAEVVARQDAEQKATEPAE